LKPLGSLGRFIACPMASENLTIRPPIVDKLVPWLIVIKKNAETIVPIKPLIVEEELALGWR
jgi:hypothetical protein